MTGAETARILFRFFLCDFTKGMEGQKKLTPRGLLTGWYSKMTGSKKRWKVTHVGKKMYVTGTFFSGGPQRWNSSRALVDLFCMFPCEFLFGASGPLFWGGSRWDLYSDMDSIRALDLSGDLGLRALGLSPACGRSCGSLRMRGGHRPPHGTTSSRWCVDVDCPLARSASCPRPTNGSQILPPTERFGHFITFLHHIIS